MSDIEELYGKYCTEYETEWVDSSNIDRGFNIFFSGGKGHEYRLYVRGDYIEINRKRKLLGLSYWGSTDHRHDDHRHYDNKNDTIKDVEQGVNEYLRRYQNMHRGGKTHYGVILRDIIEGEKKGEEYRTTPEDKVVLKEMLKEINALSGRNFKYFAELDHYHVDGAGEIVRKYIHRFSSEMPKALILSQMWMDNIDGCDELILSMYYDFKKSREYLARTGQASPAYICANYDNSFCKMKSKRIEDRLIELMGAPMDAYILAVTGKMLSRRRPDDMKPILLRYAEEIITPAELGMDEQYAEDYIPAYSFVTEQLKYGALRNLKYCRGDEVLAVLQDNMNGQHKGFAETARKSYDYISKREA